MVRSARSCHYRFLISMKKLNYDIFYRLWMCNPKSDSISHQDLPRRKFLPYWLFLFLFYICQTPFYVCLFVCVRKMERFTKLREANSRSHWKYQDLWSHLFIPPPPRVFYLYFFLIFSIFLIFYSNTHKHDYSSSCVFGNLW